jgi:hypothetical protein
MKCKLEKELMLMRPNAEKEKRKDYRKYSWSFVRKVKEKRQNQFMQPKHGDTPAYRDTHTDTKCLVGSMTFLFHSHAFLLSWAKFPSFKFLFNVTWVLACVSIMFIIILDFLVLISF